MVPNCVVLSVASSRCASRGGRPARPLRRRSDAARRPGRCSTRRSHADARAPRIALEELDGDEVVVRIQATPENAADGPKLAGEVLARRRRGRARDSRGERRRAPR